MRALLQGLGAAALLCSAFTVTAQSGARARPAASEAWVPMAAPAVQPMVASLNEGFDNISTLTAAGWVMENRSVPLGLQPNWFQGTATTATPTPGPFNAFDGADNSYIAANFQMTTGNNTISAWLLTPQVEFGDGANLTFYTRKPVPNPTDYADRLEVRISTNGASTNLGSGSGATGDFTTVALTINPTLTGGGAYPYAWTQYTIDNASLPRNGSGRIAFRYFVTSGGPTGANSDYIGIDRVVYAGGTPAYQVSGTTSGLAGSGLALTLNGGTPLAIAANGAFQFPAWVQTGSTYTVAVSSLPSTPGQTCTVTNGTGTITTANITNVQVNCVTNTYTIGGTVSGLAGSGLVLQNNAGDDLPVAADGSFTFATPVADLGAYNVSVSAQPTAPSQVCSVVNGSGNVAAANVTNVQVNCVINTFDIGGTVSGLVGGSVEIQVNGGSTQSVSVDGSYTFATLLDGQAYTVTVTAQPELPAQTCSVSNGSGTLAGADVTNVDITCVTQPFTLDVISGGGQSANLNTLYADPLVVELTDGNGDPVADAEVTFDAPDSGQSVVFETGSESGEPLTVTTDEDGRAAVMATANGSAGCVPVYVSSANASTVGFELTNVNPEPEIYQDGFEALPALAKGLGLCL